MLDKSCPKGLKEFAVERGYTKRPPIPHIPVEDDVASVVVKASEALEYKLELPGGTKVQQALWESGSVEAFLKHVMSAMSYITRKGYFEEYAEAEREAGQAVFDARVADDLWMAAPEPPAGEILPQLTALREAKRNVDNKHLACAEVAGKMFVLYENFLSENAELNGPL